MKQLSQQQIQFLDKYLIKNKVKYWDLRMELLDHIINAMEEHMSKGDSFENALMEVHKSFGNKENSKHLNKDNTQWIITKSIYADNSGYKKLIQDKRLELNRGLFKAQRQLVLGYFKKPWFLLLYSFLIVLLYGLSKLNIENKQFFLIVLALLLLPFLVNGIFWLRNYKKTKSLLFFSGLSTLGFLSISLFNIFVFLPRVFINSTGNELPKWSMIVLFSGLLPLVISEVELFVSQFRKFNKIHKKFL